MQISNSELLQLKSLLRRERRTGGCPKRALKINVILALAKGRSLRDTADALELDLETVRSYQTKYESGKTKELFANKYIGSQAYLSEPQINQLKIELRCRLYRTTKSIQDYVKRTFEVEYSRSGMTRLLHEIGFSYKKPKKMAQKSSLADNIAFLENVLKPALSDNSVVNYFMDASHPTIQTEQDYGWFERGKETVLSSQGTRSRLNILGSILPYGKRVVIDFPERVNAESVAAHWLKILNSHPAKQKINIFCDNGSANVSASKDPRVQSQKNLNVIFLPVYSPNLNLSERLWLLLKKHVINNQYFESVKDMKNSIFRKICRWRAFPVEIKNTLAPNFHVFNSERMIFT